MFSQLEKSIASYSIRQCLKNPEKYIFCESLSDMETMIEADFENLPKPVSDYVAFMVWDWMLTREIINPK